MSPTLSFLLTLTLLLPQAFPTSIPASLSGTSYHIPDTTLSIRPILPPGPPLPLPLPSTLTLLTAALSNITATIASSGDTPLPHTGWRFPTANIVLSATPPYRNLGTYGQLASGIQGLRHLMTVEGGAGARVCGWAVSDGVKGVVLVGDVGVEGVMVGGGRVLLAGSSGTGASAVASATGTGTATATGTATPVPSWAPVAFREYDS